MFLVCLLGKGRFENGDKVVGLVGLSLGIFTLVIYVYDADWLSW
jgi:hypothetical protein